MEAKPHWGVASNLEDVRSAPRQGRRLAGYGVLSYRSGARGSHGHHGKKSLPSPPSPVVQVHGGARFLAVLSSS